MKYATVSAPGKVMILGEYAVLEGFDCLVAAVSSRIRSTVRVRKEGKDTFILDGGVNNQFAKAVLAEFRNQRGSRENWTVETESVLQGISGLGSSSASTVAILAGLLKASDVAYTQRELFEEAARIVRTVQRGVSAYDVAAAVYGGVLLYSVNSGVKAKLKTSTLPMIIAYSGEKAHTAQMIRSFRKSRWSRPSEFRKMAKLVSAGYTYLSDARYEKLGSVLYEGHALLKRWKVSTKKLKFLAIVNETSKN